MSDFVTKILLNPLFRFFFWLAVSIWLVIVGVFNIGLISWIGYIAAIPAIGSVIINAEKAIAYFRKTE